MYFLFEYKAVNVLTIIKKNIQATWSRTKILILSQEVIQPIVQWQYAHRTFTNGMYACILPFMGNSKISIDNFDVINSFLNKRQIILWLQNDRKTW